MSDPGYGDLSVNVNHDPERVVGMCFVAPGTRNTRNRTRENNVLNLLIELLYNNVNKKLHLQELYSSARASRNSQKCFKVFLAGSIFAQTVDLLVLALTVYL